MQCAVGKRGMFWSLNGGEGNSEEANLELVDGGMGRGRSVVGLKPDGRMQGKWIYKRRSHKPAHSRIFASMFVFLWECESAEFLRVCLFFCGEYVCFFVGMSACWIFLNCWVEFSWIFLWIRLPFTELLSVNPFTELLNLRRSHAWIPLQGCWIYEGAMLGWMLNFCASSLMLICFFLRVSKF